MDMVRRIVRYSTGYGRPDDKPALMLAFNSLWNFADDSKMPRFISWQPANLSLPSVFDLKGYENAQGRA
jgi:hypothetical protein